MLARAEAVRDRVLIPTMANVETARRRDLIMHKPVSVVEPVAGFCGTGCVMTVLNHFLGTSFAAKDTFDVLAMLKGREVGLGDTADEIEISRFLGKIGFGVTLYGFTRSTLAEYAGSPSAFMKQRGIVHYPSVHVADSARAARAVLSGSGVAIGGVADPWATVSRERAKWRLFIVGGDYFVFRDGEFRRSGGHAGHLTVCSGTKAGKFVIHDPGPYAISERLVSRARMSRSTMYYGGDPVFIMVEHAAWKTALGK